MKKIFVIASKEIRTSLVSPLAYVVFAGFLLVSGFFFFSLLQQFNSFIAETAFFPAKLPSLNDWVSTPFFQTQEIILIFLIPVLTMRAVAQEKKEGTFELLVTSPLKNNEIVFGKFLGFSLIMTIMLLLSFAFPIALICTTNVEIGPIMTGFLGMLLFTLSFTSLGIAVSSLTKNQTVAGTISLVLFIVFFVIDAPAGNLGGNIGAFLTYIAPSEHIEEFVKGVIQGTDIMYFLSLILVGLFISNRALDTQRWR